MDLAGELPNWQDCSYLALGNPRQQSAYRLLQDLDLFNTLADFHPVLAGTIPLGIDTPDSDLDIICETKEAAALADVLSKAYGELAGFEIKLDLASPAHLVARFKAGSHLIEVFSDHIPAVAQNAVRHMVIEARLLKIGGDPAMREITRLKLNGNKTEPAFANYFGIPGDPYAALLRIAEWNDQRLAAAVASRNWE